MSRQPVSDGVPVLKSARTRERILDAAAFVLSRHGYAGTRLADIAEVAELQAPALYYYFESREALIEEVMRLGTRVTREHVVQALQERPPDIGPMERICVAVEAHLRVVLQLSDYATASTRNTGQLPVELRQRQHDEHARYGAVWRTLLEEAQAAGALAPGLDIAAARMLVLGALNSAPEWWKPGRGSIRSLVLTAQQIVRGGLTGDLPASPATGEERDHPHGSVPSSR